MGEVADVGSDTYPCRGCDIDYRVAEWPPIEVMAFRFHSRDCYDAWLRDGFRNA